MVLNPIEVRASCDKFLSYDGPMSAKQMLQRIADYAADTVSHDEFGHGELFDLLEGRLAKIFGQEAAVFMPTGRMAQLIGLKIWCRRRSNTVVAMHPRSHLEESESKAYSLAYGLQSVPLGDAHRVTTPDDLLSLKDQIAVITLEIPLLALGCRLPSWSDLVEMSAIARRIGVPLHADAARIWECQPYYDKPYEEIAGLFDSLYVSTYKGLSAISGGALVGSHDLIEEARVWQLRFGGTPRIMMPYLIDSLRALEQKLPLMSQYYQKAVSLAAALRNITDLWVTPDPPQSNTFLIAIKGNHLRLRDCVLEVASETGLWLVEFVRPAGIDGLAQFQVVVGDAALKLDVEDVVRAMEMLIQKLR